MRGDNCFFSATGVTDGDVLEGVRYAGRARGEHRVARHAQPLRHGAAHPVAPRPHEAARAHRPLRIAPDQRGSRAAASRRHHAGDDRPRRVADPDAARPRPARRTGRRPTSRARGGRASAGSRASRARGCATACPCRASARTRSRSPGRSSRPRPRRAPARIPAGRPRPCGRRSPGSPRRAWRHSTPSRIRQRTIPRPSLISYSGARKRSSTNGRRRSTTRRSVSVYSTRIRPSDTRERNFQYVRARRSRYIGVHSASSSPAGIVTFAAWIERTLPPRVHRRVLSSRSLMTASPGVAVAQLHSSAARTASSKPSGRSLIPGGGGSVDDHLAAEAVDERPDEARLDGRDERDPVGGEAGREHWHLDDPGPAAPEDGGGAAHHLTVGQHVGAAELELVRRLLVIAGARERRDDVARGDRLRAGVDPARARPSPAGARRASAASRTTRSPGR